MDDPALEVHRPVYPLPKEILKMDRDETICKFCGVSYLIHSEIKALEDKIEKLEAKLKDYDAMKERDRNSKALIDEQNSKIEELNSMLGIKNQVISSLNNDIESKQLECNRLRSKMNEVDNDINMLIASNEQLKKTNLTTNLFINETKVNLTQQKTALDDVKQATRKQVEMFNHSIDAIKQYLKMLSGKSDFDSEELKDEINNLKSKLNQSKIDNDSKTAEISELNKQIDSLKLIKHELNSQINILKNDVEKSKTLSNTVIKFEEDNRNLRQLNNELKVKHDDLELKLRNKIFELGEISDKARHYEKEITNLQRSLENMDMNYTNDVNKLEKDLQANAVELEKYKQDYEKSRKGLQQKEKEYENNLFLNSQNYITEVGQLKTEIELYKKRMTEMETDKNAMTLAYQCQITQLKDTLKENKKQNDNWSEKLAFELNKEREKYNTQLQNSEISLKRNFEMELEIQEQKYKDLIINYQTNISDVDVKSKEKLAKYQYDLSTLQDQFRLLHDDKVNTENRYKHEMDKLRNVTKELHERLEKYTNAEPEQNEELIAKLKSEAFQRESKLHELKGILDQKDIELKKAIEEVKVLEETVNHECTERQELHDKLEQTRAELLNLKKLSYTTTQIVQLPPNPNMSSSLPRPLNLQPNHSYPENLNELTNRNNNSNVQLFTKTQPPLPLSAPKLSNGSTTSNNTINSSINGSVSSFATISTDIQKHKSNKINLAPIQQGNFKKPPSPQISTQPQMPSLFDENRRRISMLFAKK